MHGISYEVVPERVLIYRKKVTYCFPLSPIYSSVFVGELFDAVDSVNERYSHESFVNRRWYTFSLSNADENDRDYDPPYCYVIIDSLSIL